MRLIHGLSILIIAGAVGCGAGADSSPEETSSQLLSLEVLMESAASSSSRVATYAEVDNVTLEVQRNNLSLDNQSLQRYGNLWRVALEDLQPGSYQLIGRAYDNTSALIFEGSAPVELSQRGQRVAIRLSSVANANPSDIPRLRALFYEPTTLRGSAQTITAEVQGTVGDNLSLTFAATAGSLSTTSRTFTASTPLTTVETRYTAPDSAPISDSLRVSLRNQSGVGVAHTFPIEVTNSIAAQPSLRFQPVIQTISAAHSGDNLSWTVVVTDDDLLSELQASWAFSGKSFANETRTATADNVTFAATLLGYDASVSGELTFSAFNSSGDNTTLSYPVPLNWFPDNATRNAAPLYAETLSLGGSHSCQRFDNGSVACWGSNAAGQLGSSGIDNATQPTLMQGFTAQQLSLGDAHSCATQDNTTVACWGANADGQLGSSGGDNASPQEVAGIYGVRQVAAGDNHTCALLDNGSAMCWGAQAFGRLGNDNTTAASVTAPSAVHGLDNASYLSAGGGHTCALLDNDTVACWGANAAGQLGEGTNTDAGLPQQVSSLSRVTDISLGNTHSCAVTDGEVWCWGANHQAQLGLGTIISHNTPQRVAGIDDAVRVFAGGDHTCALRSGGQLQCWGSNTNGQVGAGDLSDPVYSPLMISSDTFHEVSLGAQHTCALRADNRTLCWGANASGQLGDGTTTPREVPTEVQ
jgi:alpha-tubulin suppressor-like RCC1 family protein